MFSKTRSNQLRRTDSKKTLVRKVAKRTLKTSQDANYESLEKRQLLAWDVSLSSINALNFSGPSDSANNLVLTINAGGFAQHNLPLSGNLVSSLDLDSSLPGEQKLLAASVQSVSVVCNNIGNIDGSAWNQAPMNITGSSFDDIIVGSSGGDYIDAKAGNDQVWGLDGNDRIFGETGNDTIYGGNGNDKLNSALHTDIDDDTIYGDAGDDEITLGYGHDYAYGGAGTDYLVDFVQVDAILTDTVYTADGTTINNHEFEQVYIQGSDGPNHLDGSMWTLSPLTIYGSGGDDILKGGSGADWLYGGFGNDTVQGNAGADQLEGEEGNDSLYGDAGGDDLRGGVGTNFIWGGTQNDNIFVVGADTVDGGSEVDTLSGTNGVNYWIVFEANGGSLNGLRFEKIENIKGGMSNDILTLEPVGSLSGSVDLGLGADTVELQDLSGPLTVDKNINAWTVVGYTGLITNNERFIGNGDSQSKVSGDVFTSNWRLGTSNNFWVNRVSFNNFRVLESENSNDNLTGPGVETGWALVGNNSGIVQAASTYLTFNGFANLNGGVKDDLLIVYPGASLSGNFNGGAGRNAVDYSNWSTGVSVNLNTLVPGNATGVGGVLRNVAGVIGGSGNDTMIGNSSRMNLLIGNDGNDALSGGGVRDIIFGGLGTDLISGGSGEDILVGGKTTYDNDVDAIRAILAEWTTNARGFQQRSDNIYGTGTGTRLNGNYFLNDGSVIDDGVLDTISGGNGQDWFFAQLGEITDFVSGGSTPDRRN